MVRYIEWLSADDIILDSKYMIKTIKDLYVNKHHILKDEKYNPCNVRLIAVAIRHILLLDIDDESLTDMIDNIEFKINDDEFNYIHNEVKYVYANSEVYHILKIFGIYDN